MSGGGKLPVLNASMIQRRIRELDLRHWWIAEQIGISRRTLQRWLAGQTCPEPGTLTDRLAELLSLPRSELFQSQGLDFARAEDQIVAARALLESDLLEQAIPAHQFQFVEQIARGLAVPGLDAGELGHVYLAICLATFRQGRLADAGHFAGLARQCADQAGDDTLCLKADMQLAYQSWLQGKREHALKQDEANLALARKLGDIPLIAANLSNVADQYVDVGRFERSRLYQQAAIRFYEILDKPANLCFCYLGLAFLSLAADDAHAITAIGDARAVAEAGQFRRGIADCDLIEAEAYSRGGDLGRSILLLERAMATYEALNIREARAYAYAARIYAAADREDDANNCVELALQAADGWPGLVRQVQDLCAPCHPLSPGVTT